MYTTSEYTISYILIKININNIDHLLMQNQLKNLETGLSESNCYFYAGLLLLYALDGFKLKFD